ncbi:solute carrier family 35 member F3-like [Amphiura filiformis]|uniref:solute carrier family 35 member F3-like n=1 Tax=Amphiura filiformis TaxID=82378 RepID=UPI003B228BBB
MSASYSVEAYTNEGITNDEEDLSSVSIEYSKDKRNGDIETGKSARPPENQKHTDAEAHGQQEIIEEEPNSATDIKKWLFGFGIVIGIAVSWVGATQFAQSTYSDDFFAPSFNVWFSTVWMFVCYPVYVVGAMVIKSENRSWEGIQALNREAEKVFGRRGLNLKAFFILSGSFCCCWAVTNYMYVYALGLIAAADVTALFASNTAFIYAFSWIWLHERIQLLPARGISVALSICGIVLIAYADGFSGPTALGVALSVGAAIGSALYKVLYKKYVGDATYGQVSLFLTVLSVFNSIFLWPFFVIFYYTGFEIIEWDKIPWDYLCGNAALGVVFNFLVNFGIALTYPLFIALGTVVGIPLNAVVDFLFRNIAFGAFKIGGTIFIIFGFVIMLMPERWQELCWPKNCGEQSPLLDKSGRRDENANHSKPQDKQEDVRENSEKL